MLNDRIREKKTVTLREPQVQLLKRLAKQQIRDTESKLFNIRIHGDVLVSNPNPVDVQYVEMLTAQKLLLEEVLSDLEG